MTSWRFMSGMKFSNGTRVDNDMLAAIGRMAGNTYSHTRDRFEINRPG